MYVQMAYCSTENNVALTLLGIVDASEKFRLFITDAAAYNNWAAKALSANYTKMLHVSCFCHMTNRISISLVEDSDVNNLVSCIKKVFNKCPSRKKARKPSTAKRNVMVFLFQS